MAYQLALLAAFALIGGAARPAVRALQHLPLEQRFGFNRMTWSSSLADMPRARWSARSIGLPLAALILWLMRRRRRAVVAVGLGRLDGFNCWCWCCTRPSSRRCSTSSSRSPTTSLKARVQALMQRCGFAAKGLFVMDGSRRSAHANAYFTGFGAAKRVVFFDTLLTQLAPGEVEAVLAHELGHFKHKHIVKRIVLMFAIEPRRLRAAGLAVDARPGSTPASACSRNSAAPNDALALLLFMLVVPVFAFFVSPLLAQLSRKHEFEADAYAVRTSRAAATWPSRCSSCTRTTPRR